jgi:hypothetical protein
MAAHYAIPGDGNGRPLPRRALIRSALTTSAITTRCPDHTGRRRSTGQHQHGRHRGSAAVPGYHPKGTIVRLLKTRAVMPLLALALATGTVTALSPAAPAAAADCPQISFTNPYVGFAVTVPTPTLALGSTGPCVAELQDYLNLAINANLAVDSDFGPKTKAAVEAYQSQNNACARGVDGMAGHYTMSCLIAGSG